MSRQRGRCCGETKICHHFGGACCGSWSLAERLMALWAIVGNCLGKDSWASQGRPHTDTGKSNPPIPCATETTHCPQDRALEEWHELHADPPYHLPQGNQYILTSNSHTPGGCYGWGGGGRTESKQQQQEQS